MNLPPIYIMCHPEYEPIRYQLLLSHLPKCGIPLSAVHWVRGPWGSELSVDDILKVYDPFNVRYGFNMALSFKSAALSRGEISLVLTFYQAIQQALCFSSSSPPSADDIFLFFESDVVLREDFLERLGHVLDQGAVIGGQSWDYISLGEGVGTRPQNCNESYFSEQLLYKPPHQWVFRCCDSMLFRRSFLEKVWQTFIPFRECLDWEMNIQMMLHKGIALWADPPLAEPGTARGRFHSSLPA